MRRVLFANFMKNNFQTTAKLNVKKMLRLMMLGHKQPSLKSVAYSPEPALLWLLIWWSKINRKIWKLKLKFYYFWNGCDYLDRTPQLARIERSENPWIWVYI